MIRPIAGLAALGLLALAPATAQAARSWVLPSSTTLSGSNAWITVDAATSDEMFFPNLRPLRLETIQILDSEAQAVAPQSGMNGKFRSTFDIQVTKPGTYKITSLSTTVTASWTQNGEVKRFRGTAEEFAAQKPADAADLKTIRNVARHEAFVTRDTPTTEVFKPTGKDLEMVPVTHPADVVVGEAASFRLLLDGKPAAGLEVVLVRGGDHWKAKPHEITTRTGPDGVFKVTLPEGGIWLMSATYRTGETGRGPGGPPPGPPGGGEGGPRPPAQPLAGDGYSANYTATFEAQLP